MAWTRKNINVDIFVTEDDVREILDICPPQDVVAESGEIVHRCAMFVIAGPKGGRLNLRLPDWYWDEISGVVASEELVPGDGLDKGGWLHGKFVRPRYYEA